MHRLFILLCLTLCTVMSQGQNLVPNPSFEDTVCVPKWGEQDFFGAAHWFNPTAATPDYLGIVGDPSCDLTSIMSPGLLAAGEWQIPFDGNKMVGLRLGSPNNCSRDYLEVELLQSLLPQHIYTLSMQVNLSNMVNFGTDCIGASLTKEAIVDFDSACELGTNATISNPGGSAVLDTLNWVEISGTFTANGGEKYLTIGNFVDEALCSFESTIGTNNLNFSYYYIDYIEMIEDSSISVDENYLSFRAWAVPSIQSIAVSTSFDGYMNLFSANGQHLLSSELQIGNQLLSLPSLNAGMYVLVFRDNSSNTGCQKLIIQ